jgi:hypothetical protein
MDVTVDALMDVYILMQQSNRRQAAVVLKDHFTIKRELYIMYINVYSYCL